MAQYAAVNALTIVALLVGIACLVGGAELLVKGAATIASRLGIAPVVIGLTVVAFGTSAPELAVSVSAAFGGDADVAFGNVVGSNIVNILLILGASAVVGGLAVQQRIIRFDIPLLIIVSVVALLMSLDNNIGRVDGFILFIGIVVYVGWLVRESRGEPTDVVDEYTESVETLEGAASERPLWFNLMLVAAGLVVLVVGSQLLVNGATDIAESAGVSDLVIGLTVVAIGTSLPELATSILAALRGRARHRRRQRHRLEPVQPDVGARAERGRVERRHPGQRHLLASRLPGDAGGDDRARPDRVERLRGQTLGRLRSHCVLRPLRGVPGARCE